MREDLMLKCLIAFILGWFLSRQMGNGFRVGAERGLIDSSRGQNETFTKYYNKLRRWVD